MANELLIEYPTGATLYALLFNSTGQVWNGSAFEAPVAVNWANYDIAMVEVATTGLYRAAMPAVVAGVYSVGVRKQAGGTPAVADIAVGNGRIEWDGSAEVALSSRASQTSVDTIDGIVDAIKLKTDLLDTASFTVASGIDGDEITIRPGATFDETITGLTIPSDWVKVLFTLKTDDNDPDANAVLQVVESNPGAGTDGLIRINGAAPGTGENARAELMVTQAAGTVRIRLHQLATASLAPMPARWDLKVITSDSPAEGTPLVVSSPAVVKWTTTRTTA